MVLVSFAKKTADVTPGARASFSAQRKVLTGSSCKGKRLEVHATHILFVWRLCSGQHFLSQAYLFSIFSFSYSFRLFFSSLNTFWGHSCNAWQATFWMDFFQNNLWQCGSGWSLVLLLVLALFCSQVCGYGLESLRSCCLGWEKAVSFDPVEATMCLIY